MWWFGETWQAPACEPGRQVDAPVGKLCGWCEEEIEDGHRGFILPYLGPFEGCVIRGSDLALPPGMYLAYHLECQLRQTFGSVGHIEGRCHCVGGDEEDPPGLTAREAAIAAVAAYERKHGTAVT